MQQNIATALAVTRELGINDEVALRGMQKAEPDPGAASCGHVAVAGRDFSWIDATAANDPESLDLLVAGLAGAEERRRASLIAVFNHRADRPFRLLTFAQSSTAFRNSTTILLTGNRPSVSLVVRVRRSCPGAAVRFVASRHLEAAVEDALSRATDEIGVLFCGNTRGWTRPVLADCERPPTHLRSSLATSVPSGELRRGRRDQRRMTND